MKIMRSLNACIFVGLLVFVLTQLSSSSAERERRQLPCNHALRISFPQFFTHCDSVRACTYSSWSSWKRVADSEASTPKCPSGLAYREERTRIKITGTSCTEPLLEIQHICVPTREERLIMALGLGGSGNNYESFHPSYLSNSAFKLGPQGPPDLAAAPTKFPGPSSRRKRGAPLLCPHPQTGHPQKICNHLDGLGKRSTKKQERPVKIIDENILPHDIDPIPFDRHEHGRRLRSRRSACGDSDEQYVLFVLDTSGSIGGKTFKNMTHAIGLLPSLFCKQVKFAVITFSTYINLEFCFNCFDNTRQGRQEVTDAINDIAFLSGKTNTGATAKCICDKVLRPTCGIDKLHCLDVVFITDGKSNDRKLEICEEIKCLHDPLDGINTYAIGIKSRSGSSYDKTELDCITNFSSLTSVFEFASFTDFQESIYNIASQLAFSSNDAACYKVDGFSPTGAVPSK